MNYTPNGYVSGTPGLACCGPSGVTACVSSNHTNASNLLRERCARVVAHQFGLGAVDNPDETLQALLDDAPPQGLVAGKSSTKRSIPESWHCRS